METLQKMFEREMATVPHRLFERQIEKKLNAEGIKPTDELLGKLTEHILSGSAEPFSFDSNADEKDVTLTLEDADFEEVTKAIDHFVDEQLPEMARDVAVPISAILLKDLKSRWIDEHALQVSDISEFRERMQERWGVPLGQLKMLLTISREWCQGAHSQEKIANPADKPHLKNLLIRLLVRGCQVTDEIICLLENGFADGAMARWRTLHEIAVVAVVLSNHGEDIAARYVAHQAVESMRSMRKYICCCEELGYTPLSDREVAKITAAYDAVVIKYGKPFTKDYGWAAFHLNSPNPSFADLEKLAGKAEMRAHYQMANDNVHAGIKSMFVRLGLLEDYSGLLAGRSNAGLIEPGQNTAHTLTQLTVLVCLSKGRLDDLVFAEVMRTIRDRIPRLFSQADKRLRKDDKKYKVIEKRKKH
jgi:hypothetical protein